MFRVAYDGPRLQHLAFQRGLGQSGRRPYRRLIAGGIDQGPLGIIVLHLSSIPFRTLPLFSCAASVIRGW